jgi:NifB/MoaA-like Fe-S oxidoreductase
MSEITNNKLMVSQYKEFKINLGNRNLIEILQEIKFEKFQSDVKSIRYALHEIDEKLRFLKSEIDNFLMQGRKKTFAETAIEAEQYCKTKKG